MSGPDSRWHDAQQLADAAATAMKQRVWKRLDAATREAVDYIRRCKQGPEAKALAAKTYPAIAAAQAAWDDPQIRTELKILILANCPADEIARVTGIAPEAEHAVEQLFFDVRTSRSAPGWIQRTAIEPEAEAGNGELASKLRLAFLAGPIAARLILTPDAQLPLNSAHRLLHRQMRLHLKATQALAMPLDTPVKKERCLKQFNDLNLAEQRIRLAQQRLQYRCAETLRQLEVARCRAERQARREQARAARRQEELARAKERQECAATSPLAQLRWHCSATASIQVPSTPSKPAVAGVAGEKDSTRCAVAAVAA
jgi:hypothetical protein